ncbi:FHA domain-containing protein [Nitrincola nitratireducens]|uniref:Putative ABC transporter ATP-binding protein YbhF n=1 Tax=Nitrincola nitratireducens TaxID=1229521 RepID=W9UWL1_9GAMM|nr:FHA domain-containing protein [Nitrincola nitratireducens]EXJ09116.1 putative ABC transporter ATP-binding protein YbhF [Nitrincola nitratireducens]
MKLKSQTSSAHDVVLLPGENLLGRGSGCTHVLSDTHVSGQHIRIFQTSAGWMLEDLCSTNGTYLNGARLVPGQHYMLVHGQQVMLGDAAICFEVIAHIDSAAVVENTPGTHSRPVFTVGRAADNHVVIDAAVVSSHHLQVQQLANGRWQARDLNSTNGTYLILSDGFKPVKEWLLDPEQVLLLGNYRLPVERLFAYMSSQSQQQAARIKVSADSLVVGRDPKADISVPHSSVSWHHARLQRRGNAYEIEDLGSTNGTVVNGVLISKPTLLKAQDELMLGLYSFHLEIDENQQSQLVKNSTLDGLTLEARGISKTVGLDTHLLDNISLTIHPGELVGLMGLSGAGKTTLLKALNGYDKPTQGSSYINGIDIYNNFHLFKTWIGYVPQDDIVHPELTVYEALHFYARLRLPPDMQASEVDARIQETLSKLGLAGVEHTLIGSPDTEKGISGGQRKRVNLAMELLADPKIIFLDEPTSGLSAVDTRMVMELLRALANEARRSLSRFISLVSITTKSWIARLFYLTVSWLTTGRLIPILLLFLMPTGRMRRC